MFESFAQRFVQTGGLVVRLPTGRDLVLGDAQSQASPLVVGLQDHMVAARVMRNPALHLGEAYMDGALIIERGRFGEVSPAIERAGLLVTDIEIMRLHYAETLRHWRERFASKSCRSGGPLRI